MRKIVVRDFNGREVTLTLTRQGVRVGKEHRLPYKACKECIKVQAQRQGWVDELKRSKVPWLQAYEGKDDSQFILPPVIYSRSPYAWFRGPRWKCRWCGRFRATYIITHILTIEQVNGELWVVAIGVRTGKRTQLVRVIEEAS